MMMMRSCSFALFLTQSWFQIFIFPYIFNYLTDGEKNPDLFMNIRHPSKIKNDDQNRPICASHLHEVYTKTLFTFFSLFLVFCL